ncbi:MAG: NADH-quinone oxidoreductase subunit N [Deltaproteobacteria bacterium]|nr:NADH-quinone oxidoreductase subunit N [Deltaproteobacteria bacterium]
MTLTIPTFSLISIGPWLTLALGAILILLVDALSKGRKTYFPYFSLAVLALAAFQTIDLWGAQSTDFARMVYVDNFAFLFYLILILGAALTILLSRPYLEEWGKDMGEYYALILFATVGMMMMAASAHMIMIFLGLEVMSIAVYVLAGFFREDARSNEAALKYLVLGAFASAFLLFGMAFLYGAAGGSLYLDELAKRLTDAATLTKPLTLLAIALLVVGFGFKVAAVPFHMWTPDVYEGAPTSITAYMAVAVKAAAFAAFARVFFLAFPAFHVNWHMLLWVLAVATMTLGNVVAIAQTNIKRMLAYSSIAHAGYILVALVAANQLGAVSILYYLLAYTLMNIGAFGVVILVARKKDSYLNIYDYSGLAYQHPGLAAGMAVFMFALAGMPPTAGFVGKFYIFSAAVQAGYIWLAILGVMNSLVSVYYYLRITVLMYMRPAEADLGPIAFTPAVTACVIATAVATVLVGIFPGWFYDLAMNSVKIFPSL